jgi:hypothetical protein
MNPLVLFPVRLRAGDIRSATVFAQHVIEGLDDEPLQRLTEFDRQQLERFPPALAQTGLHIAELHAAGGRGPCCLVCRTGMCTRKR